MPLDAASPRAYTVAYLDAHPEAMVQPEHLVIMRLDPSSAAGSVVVRLHVREAMTLRLGSHESARALSHVTVHDPDGTERLHHVRGEETAAVRVEPGAYRIVFHAAVATDGAARPQTLFVRLAAAPVRAGTPALKATAGTSAGEISASCIGCSFDGSDLRSVMFGPSTDLSDSSFVGADISGARFDGVRCTFCDFTGATAISTDYRVDANSTGFVDADLARSRLGSSADWRADWSYVDFSGASLAGAVLFWYFTACNFGPSPTSGKSASLAYSDLTQATLSALNGALLNRNGFRGTDFTNARVHSRLFPGLYGETAAIMSLAFAGAKFDGMQPNDLFIGASLRGFDFSGTSFGGMNLAGVDLSLDNGVTLSAHTNLSTAILSDGTVGANLSGHDFGVGYKQFAGTAADEGSGKDLRFVNLSGVSLYQADLTRANLSGATLYGANLAYTNLYAAKLVGVQGGAAPGDESRRPANLTGAYMPLGDLTDADLRSAPLDRMHFYGADGSPALLTRARLDAASLTGANLTNTRFVSASLNDTSFAQATLVNAGFDAATLTNAKFLQALLQGGDFSSSASVDGADLSSAVVSTTAGAFQFTENDGSTSTYQYGATRLGAFASFAGVTCPSSASGPCSGGKLVPAVPPYPAQPACVPKPPRYDNCPPPSPH